MAHPCDSEERRSPLNSGWCEDCDQRWRLSPTSGSQSMSCIVYRCSIRHQPQVMRRPCFEAIICIIPLGKANCSPTIISGEG